MATYASPEEWVRKHAVYGCLSDAEFFARLEEEYPGLGEGARADLETLWREIIADPDVEDERKQLVGEREFSAWVAEELKAEEFALAHVADGWDEPRLRAELRERFPDNEWARRRAVDAWRDASRWREEDREPIESLQVLERQRRLSLEFEEEAVRRRRFEAGPFSVVLIGFTRPLHNELEDELVELVDLITALPKYRDRPDAAREAVERAIHIEAEPLITEITQQDAIYLKRVFERRGARVKIERVATGRGGSGTRQPLPESVRREVWRRDEGKCVDCGSRERLEFDHIIPLSKGGSNTTRNIELRCESCNRQKAARV